MECAYSEFFEEPELFVRILSRRFRAVSETCVREITMREEKHHLLITVTDGGVGRLHLRHTELMCSFNEGRETRQLLVESTLAGRHLRNLRRYRFANRQTPLKSDVPN